MAALFPGRVRRRRHPRPLRESLETYSPRRKASSSSHAHLAAQYFFYISRLLGVIVSWLLRLALWRSTNSYFEIGAVKVSLLGGSIQFNDFRYISRNQSLRIVRGRELVQHYCPS